MKNIPLNKVKRMIDIENALLEIKKESEIKASKYIDIINILIDYLGDLDALDIEYANLAIKLPYEQIKVLYEGYLNNKDKIKEEDLINYIKEKYDIEKFYIIRRLEYIKCIKNVERLNLYHKVNIEDKHNKTKGGK